MVKQLYKIIIPERLRIKLIHFKARVTARKYAGDNVKCNCCGKTFDTFLPFGNPPRANALCPNCLSLERTRVLKFYLDDYFKSQNSSTHVLHFAPEMALVNFIKGKVAHYVSADISKEVAETVVDITNMQFDDNSFDLIICSHVLAHVKDESKAIDEMHRVLKIGGKAIIITTIFDSDKTDEDIMAITPQQKFNRFGQDDIWRKHGKDFIDRLKRDGLDVNRVDYRGNLNSDVIKYHGLGESSREVFYILDKKM